MRHLGIVAHSVEGAALCYREFCHEGARRLGAYDHPDVTLDGLAMARSMPAWERGDYDPIRAHLAQSVARLARAGAHFFVVPDNSAHLALERPGPPFALPGLHIAEVVAERAAALGTPRVGVLGTKFTMDGPIYRRALASRGIEAVVPDADERDSIHAVIFDELVNGIFTAESRERYLRVIHGLADRGCTAVALVCTEIPLLVTPEVSPLPTLDSTRLLAVAALEVSLGERPLPSWRGGSPAA
jgi:aspartate racemase